MADGFNISKNVNANANTNSAIFNPFNALYLLYGAYIDVCTMYMEFIELIEEHASEYAFQNAKGISVASIEYRF